MTWRLNDNHVDYATAETIFKEYYYPGLLQDIMKGNRPSAQNKY
jgi:hypothetical protein